MFSFDFFTALYICFTLFRCPGHKFLKRQQTTFNLWDGKTTVINKTLMISKDRMAWWNNKVSEWERKLLHLNITVCKWWGFCGWREYKNERQTYFVDFLIIIIIFFNEVYLLKHIYIKSKKYKCSCCVDTLVFQFRKSDDVGIVSSLVLAVLHDIFQEAWNICIKTLK